jgi:hypothetical protein
MSGHPLTFLGTVTESQELTISDGYDSLVHMEIPAMVDAWQNALDMTGGVA